VVTAAPATNGLSELVPGSLYRIGYEAAGRIRTVGIAAADLDAGELVDAFALDELLRDARILVALDGGVPAGALVDELSARARATSVERVDPPRKSLAAAQALWDRLIAFKPTLVVGIGGGTLLDLVGFVAGTYQRGLPRIVFPTTLLAMIDACIGGKTAIDYADVKNSVGCLTYARDTICWQRFLATVPPALRSAGVSEAVKIAALYDAGFFAELESRAARLATEPGELTLLVKAAALKAELVSDPDAAATGLLFGHNVAHALEVMTGLNHGLCVSIGVAIESAAAVGRGALGPDAFLRIATLLRRLGLPTALPPKTDVELLARHVAAYKLTDDHATRFVVPSRIGQRFAGPTGFLVVERFTLADVLETSVALLAESLAPGASPFTAAHECSDEPSAPSLSSLRPVRVPTSVR
jgi:3-dehydroquinate synthase